MVEVDVINALRREGLGSRFQCLNHKKVLNVRKRKLIAQLRELIRIIRGGILMWHEFARHNNPEQFEKWMKTRR